MLQPEKWTENVRLPNKLKEELWIFRKYILWFYGCNGFLAISVQTHVAFLLDDTVLPMSLRRDEGQFFMWTS